MVGDGPDRARCEEICRENHLCDNVTFLGKQDAVEELLAVSDLFLMPSEQESFGLAALEAMACRVPVVSSNAGGLPASRKESLHEIENKSDSHYPAVGNIAYCPLL